VTKTFSIKISWVQIKMVQTTILSKKIQTVPLKLSQKQNLLKIFNQVIYDFFLQNSWVQIQKCVFQVILFPNMGNKVNFGIFFKTLLA
jgi:hypothetical protein